MSKANPLLQIIIIYIKYKFKIKTFEVIIMEVIFNVFQTLHDNYVIYICFLIKGKYESSDDYLT